jgi:hypothetical protein
MLKSWCLLVKSTFLLLKSPFLPFTLLNIIISDPRGAKPSPSVPFGPPFGPRPNRRPQAGARAFRWPEGFGHKPCGSQGFERGRSSPNTIQLKAKCLVVIQGTITYVPLISNINPLFQIDSSDIHQNKYTIIIYYNWGWVKTKKLPYDWGKSPSIIQLFRVALGYRPPDRSGISGMPWTGAHLGMVNIPAKWGWLGDGWYRSGCIPHKNIVLEGEKVDLKQTCLVKMDENGMIRCQEWQIAIGYPNVYSENMRDGQSRKVGSWVLEKWKWCHIPVFREFHLMLYI